MKTKYIAFLRGINVGGHSVKMERLREIFSELGFENVRTYIQTGNVFFETDEQDRIKLRNKIEAHLVDALGYAVPTFLRTTEELEHTLKVATFHSIELTPDTRHLILFTLEPLTLSIDFPYLSPKGGYEIVGATENELFVVVHMQNGRFESGNSLEKALSVVTTGRFFHTAQKILEAAKQ